MFRKRKHLYIVPTSKEVSVLIERNFVESCHSNYMNPCANCSRHGSLYCKSCFYGDKQHMTDQYGH